MPCPLTPDIDLDPDPYSVDEVEDSSADGVEFPKFIKLGARYSSSSFTPTLSIRASSLGQSVCNSDPRLSDLTDLTA